ncbi:uncharacterized protein HMPREF1541_05349 [Cyphellophora europaea CBS 101466]|uniref:ADF-H domain-containing protein n=1 Tax=Cyphellophora europaea (strain CBS 101466) TaxID=1220924 RepID=W2RRH5_CYPE1|nr:uncharacterized protein HMPREF1541_05349 [Cyphellophora europaea CBS 101466]ETN39126.1 hypothetical protein HMPREF1541_05349 [Cyphellophora europaea CBS 101466]
MQSGISASETLHAAFADFLSSDAFALPATIDKESIQPLEPIPFSGDFNSSLPSLAPHLEPKTPIYLLIRKTPSASTFTAITYVPSIAPVRSKTLIAATRSSLVRELGLEKFEDTLFVTDAEEVLEPSQWAERAGGSSGRGVDPNLLSQEERELQSVKRAEEESRHGTGGTALGGMGGGPTSGGSKLQMKMTDDAKSALQSFSSAGAGSVMQLGIDIATETLTLLSQHADAVQPAELARSIPSDRPTYSFYRHPAAPDTALFLYVCPGTSKVKERMVYASSRSGVLDAAKSGGVEVSKRLEAGDPEEITEQRLNDEAGVSGGADAGAAKSGFARPKRPGRR